MKMGPQARRVAIAVVTVLLLFWCSGASRTLSTTGDRLGVRRFSTPAIAPGWQVSERFQMNTAGLRAITIRPALVGKPTGRVRFELRSVTPYASAVRVAEVAAAEMARDDTYRFEFAPIADSREVAYQLDVLSSPEAPSAGVALWATRGERLADGVLLINDVERWGELAFETDATGRAWADAKAWLVLGVLAIAWVALVLLWREIIGQA